jgi:hypothetical protein
VGVELVEPSSIPTLRELFEEAFPYYLSIGMSYEQFWDGDVWLTRAYAKAEELRMLRADQLAWLQGSYVYEAIGALSPILHAFAKSGTKPSPYVKEPYLSRKAVAKTEPTDPEKERYELHRSHVAALAARFEKGSEGVVINREPAH